MRGGPGADTFSIDDENQSSLTQAEILDFIGAVEGGEDMFFVPNSGTNGEWIGDQSFAGNGNPQARFQSGDSNAGNLEVDSNGDGVADVAIILNKITQADQLTSTDFIF